MMNICERCVNENIAGSCEPCYSCLQSVIMAEGHKNFSPKETGDVVYADGQPYAVMTPNEARKQVGLPPVNGVNKDSASYKAGYSDGRQSVLDELGIQTYQYEFLKTAFAKYREEETERRMNG